MRIHPIISTLIAGAEHNPWNDNCTGIMATLNGKPVEVALRDCGELKEAVFSSLKMKAGDKLTIKTDR